MTQARPPGQLERLLAASVVVAFLSACQGALVDNDPQSQTIGHLIEDNGQRPERLGISVSPSPLPAADYQLVELNRALEHYDQIGEILARPAVQAEALRRAADLRVDGVQSGLLDPDQLAIALTNYQRLLTHFPHYPGRAQVLYQQGRALAMRNDDAGAIASLEQVGVLHPGSELAAKAQFRAAEMWLRQRDYGAAAAAYTRLLALPSSDEGYRAYARYKRAWAYYQLGEFAQALADLKPVLLVGSAERGAPLALPPDLVPTDKRRGIADDAIRLAVLCLAASDQAELEAFLPPQDNSALALEITRRLVDRLLETERVADGARVALYYADSRPTSAAAPAFYRQAIGAYLNAGLPAQAVAQKAAYVERYDPGSPLIPALAEGLPATLGPGVDADVLMAYMQDVAGYYHQQAREGVAKDSNLAAATAMYQRWLARFPGSDERFAVRGSLAEAYFDGGRYALAAAEYEKLAYGDAPNGGKDGLGEIGIAKGTLTKDAAGLAAMQSQLQVLDASSGAERQGGIMRLASLSQRFLDAFPERNEGAVGLLQAARLLFEDKDFSGTLALVEGADLSAVKLPSGQRYQWDLFRAAALFQLDRFTDAEPLLRELLARPSLPEDDRETVAAHLAASVYHRVDTLRGEGQLAEAADLLQSILPLALTASVREQALFDCATLRDELGQWLASSRLLEAHARQFPHAKVSAEVDVMLARAYSALGKDAAAAAAYLRLAENNVQPLVDPAAARLKAAELYQRAGQPSQALAQFQAYLRGGPVEQDQAQQVRWQIVGLLSQNSPGRWRYLQEIVAADREAPSASEAARLIAARAHLQLAQRAAANGRRIALVVPLAKSLAVKRELMEQASAALNRAAAYGFSEVSSIALNEMGLLYQDFAGAILASQRPPDLAGEVLAEYQILLEEQAYPFEEKAISAFEHNLGHVRHGLWNEALAQSLASLEVMVPGQYSKQVHLAERYDELR